MLYHSGEITVGLTALSRSPIMAQKKGKRMRKGKGATAIKATIVCWQCSVCGTKMPLNDPSKRPKRCSNRETCGVMFVYAKE